MAAARRNMRRAFGVFRPERRLRDRQNPLEVCTPEQVRARYRFLPDTIMFFVAELNGDLERGTQRSGALPVLIQVCVCLRFMATGSFFITMGDSLVGISKASVCRVVRDVISAILTRLRHWIRFPRGPDERRVMAGFHRIAGFPQVIGAVDCTQIRIQAPVGREQDYVNRKGFHSINVQMVCDADMVITNVVAQWPGSVHDSRIFSNCQLYRELLQGAHSGHLLGDSGYACRPFLLTPYRNPQDPQQQRFNNAHTRTRVRVEQTFGVLKRRFASLHGESRMAPEKVCRLVVSCAILHNVAIARGDRIEPAPHEPDHPAPLPPGPVVEDGNQKRDRIARTVFA